jgi:hypothetical protein
MSKTLNLLSGALLVALVGLFGTRLTVLNPAWVIKHRYPSAKCSINQIDTPDFDFWATVGEFLGIQISSSSCYLNVEIDHYPGEVRLDDFRDATELHVHHSRVIDISAYYNQPGRLTCPLFTACDFAGLPKIQRRLLSSYRPNPDRPEAYPDTVWIRFEPFALIAQQR